MAHLSKPWLPVPSPSYGAIEKMVASLIISQQINSQDEILLFAPGGSVSSQNIKLIPFFSEGQGDKGLDRNTELAQATHCAIESIKQSVDLIHAHSVDPFLSITPFINLPSVFTFYSNPTPAGKQLSRMAAPHTIFTFLTHSHRKSFPWIKNGKVIYFGVNINDFPFSEKKNDYLAFVGSIVDKKGILEAIEIANKTKMKLKIAAKIKKEDTEFFETEVEIKIKKSSNIEYLGELNNEDRNSLLKGAKALLFPIKWEEPFGMVMIESMAVGTPVVAFNRGSVPEVVEDGKTGFIVENVPQAVRAIHKLDKIIPKNCRKLVSEKFDIDQTAKGFKDLYQSVLSK